MHDDLVECRAPVISEGGDDKSNIEDGVGHAPSLWNAARQHVVPVSLQSRRAEPVGLVSTAEVPFKVPF
jgi:hypothetical protein